ncbi:MAG: DUF3604 domain-containing protein [Pseudomonadales bacterium]|nr:DUF3604 domain-containing protein [Pseudomonadales bacterium]
MRIRVTLGMVGLALLASACTKVEDPLLNGELPVPSDSEPPFRESVVFNETRNLLWGDVHIHTALSYDSFTVGTRTLPDDAYTYMKGGTIQHGFGYPIRASRPLDFGAVTDHAEYLGVPRHLAGEEKDTLAEDLIAQLKNGNSLFYTALYLYKTLTQMRSKETRHENFGDPSLRAVSETAWQDIIAAAERHNDPGRFTAFIAYEWSSMPNERNLHRNVIYKSSRVPDFPQSSLDSENPEDLWRALDEQRDKGMEVLSIPHNGNVSGGRMYESTTFSGEPLSKQYAELRRRNEPLSEIFQIKGTSETHPLISPEDEFANFELMDNIMSAKQEFSQPKGSYARDALRTGLEFAHREGFNPYKFGVIGSSDSHNSSSAVEEDNFHGKLPMIDGTPSQRVGTAYLSGRVTPNRSYGAAGLVAVWAEENTRASIFEAMQRKETYATSGPRMSLRFFAGSYPEDILDGAWLAKAYDLGVPMGGELSNAAFTQEGPVFVLQAMKDPMGANLDRLQVVKAWVDSEGISHEKIFNVAASDGRMNQMNNGYLPAVGNTVDLKSATYDNTIGAAELSVLWQDPEYDASVEAFYYARAIEIPTPRYTTYDAKALGVDPLEPATIQERAVSSAIWFSVNQL